MSMKLKVYEFHAVGDFHGVGVQLIAAENKKQAQAMANEKSADGGTWLGKLREDIVTTHKGPYRILYADYFE